MFVRLAYQDAEYLIDLIKECDADADSPTAKQRDITLQKLETIKMLQCSKFATLGSTPAARPKRSAKPANPVIPPEMAQKIMES